MNSTIRLSQLQSPFPRCELHGIQIVDALPEDCPLREPDLNGAFLRLSGTGFQREFGRPGTIADFRRADTCMDCHSRFSRQPDALAHVSRLRREHHQRNTEPPKPVETVAIETPAEPTRPPQVHGNGREVVIPRHVRRNLRKAGQHV
ncbi:MAG: hypothetical protein AABZ47_09990 [Planctomycetota bacterium]